MVAAAGVEVEAEVGVGLVLVVVVVRVLLQWALELVQAPALAEVGAEVEVEEF